MGESGSFLLAAVDQMVDYTGDGLEEHHAEDHEADDRVFVVQLNVSS